MQFKEWVWTGGDSPGLGRGRVLERSENRGQVAYARHCFQEAHATSAFQARWHDHCCWLKLFHGSLWLISSFAPFFI